MKITKSEINSLIYLSYEEEARYVKNEGLIGLILPNKYAPNMIKEIIFELDSHIMDEKRNDLYLIQGIKLGNVFSYNFLFEPAKYIKSKINKERNTDKYNQPRQIDLERDIRNNWYILMNHEFKQVSKVVSANDKLLPLYKEREYHVIGTMFM